jgi:DNA-binding response OmpR family regulator
LVVEDDPGLRALVQEILSSVGYHVLITKDGNDALRVSERHAGQIHLLLTDVVLPKMGGKEIASRLTALRPEIKVLFMSGYTGNALTQQGPLDRTTDFIPKPWTPEGLCGKIRDVLGTKSSIQRILVVDDEPEIRQLLADILEGAGFQVFTAGDGREAREEAGKYPIDLVITDLFMPEEEGIEMIRAMRKEHPQLKIIAMSGGFGLEMLKVAEMLGAQAVLTKPLAAETVLGRIRELS